MTGRDEVDLFRDYAMPLVSLTSMALVGIAGGLLVVQRSYFPLLEARLADGRRLATQRVDLVLLGVEVPAGRHEVSIGSSSRPEAIAGGLSLLVLFVAAFAGWRWP